MKRLGFTLLEMLLVLVIITSIMILFISFMSKKAEQARINKMILTTQQILSASLAYHHNNGRWTDCSLSTDECYLIADAEVPIIEDGYLPHTNFSTLWPQSDTDYIQFSRPTDKKFTVCIPVYAGSATRVIADTLAGHLPMGRTTQTDNATEECSEAIEPTPCEDETLPCRVLTTVGTPGQNLDNVKSFNFAGVYHNGACVPVPACPDKMKPDILVYPTSVSGLYGGMNGTSGTSGEVIPISSFTAFAVGPAEWDKADQSGTKLGPLNCFKKSDARGCYPENGVFYLDAGTYWRVCLDIVTSKGNLSSGTWVKQSGTIMAITRCVPTNEPESSDWNVFQNK